ncbi:MAG TPA: PQQ-dependent sugar dehydrogenase [Lacipirellulaceae bacterium]
MLFALFCACAVSSRSAFCQTLGAELQLDLSGGNFSGAGYTQIAAAPGRPNELFISRQDGNIYRFDLATRTQHPFFTLPAADISTGQYWGLLGFTFAPDFATSGNLYVHVADDRNVDGHHHRIYIRRYTLNNPLSNSPTLGSTTNILRWGQHGTDHSGGWIGFQPGDPNTLWITSGDGGNREGADRDMLRTGQDPSDVLASILRVDVSGTGAGEFGNYAIPANNPTATGAPQYTDWAPEVWSIGLRSPWGGGFDRLTGDFTIGDVGASQIGGNTGQEEVNFERADSTGGRNYAWRIMEGTTCPTSQDAGVTCDPANPDPAFTMPVYDYEYGGGYGSGGAPAFEGRSVTGGLVYRGPIEELQGMYIFGDWSSHQVWGLRIDRDANGELGAVIPGSLTNFSATFNRLTASGTDAIEGVTAFGEDAAGNLYFVELGGELYKIVGPIIGVAAGDYNRDGRVDAADYVVWRRALDANVPSYTVADGDGDGMVTSADYDVWRRNFGKTIPDTGSGTVGPAVPEPASLVLMLLASSCASLMAATARNRPK